MHSVGYELFEVRNGHGLEPIHRLGDKKVKGTIEAVREELRLVFKMARSYDGDQKRSKARWFAEQYARSWEEGGMHLEEVKKMLSILP